MNAVTSIPPTEAKLPANYETAKRAISDCDRIDECKDWADKAAALATYARMAKDDSLRVMATRIQERALRRGGELLKQIPRGDEATRYGQDGTVPPITRTQAAVEAGLSERQRKTALRLASIPEHDFERQIESASPPSVTALAAQGTVSRAAQSDETPLADEERARTIEALRLVEGMGKYVMTVDPVKAARAANPHQVPALRAAVESLDRWLDRFVVSLS